VRLNRRSAAKLLVAPAVLAGLRTFASAGAEQYPAKPVRIIVPYPAGGPYDGIPRLIAQWISAQHGWSIVVDNRSGATGLIGVMAAKQASPDGHTLVVVTTSTHGSMPALKRNLAYDPLKDFVPIVLMADAPLVLLVRDDLTVHSVAQLVTMMREKPGQLNFSTGGYGSPHHLATMTLFHRAGLPQNIAVHAPFAGLAPALMALLAGNAAIHDYQHWGRHAAHRQRQAEAACDHESQAIAAAARCADHGGARLSRLRGPRLVRLGGAGGNARHRHRALERARQCGATRS
jgi:tripartite-type tricarboxylate transporter receptor subunit TctC